ncbi:MAG: hypothetical protein ACYC7D_03210 [Nitrososphaerales archaeon]
MKKLTSEERSVNALAWGLKLTPGRIALLALAFIGIAVGTAVGLAGYRGTTSISQCISSAQCAANLDLLRSLKLLSTDRAELDTGVALLIFSTLLIIYIVMRKSSP